MEQNIPLPSLDVEAAELTPTISDEPSALSVDTSRDCLHQNTNATPEEPMKWTDKKHSLYLNNLEASFVVNQLHSSTNSLGWHSQQAHDLNVTGKLPTKTCSSHDQFTVLHSGCWKKNFFKRNGSPLNYAADSQVILENSWICRLRSAGKRRIVTSSDIDEQRVPYNDGFHVSEKRNSSSRLATCPEQFYKLCHQDSVDSITEVSDQNFEDEEQENKSSSSFVAKRFKMDAADASCNDKVVPSGKLPTMKL